MNFNEYLVSEHACKDSIAWAGNRSLAQAWSECERGDWLLWLAGRLGVPCNMIVLSACDCAKLALPYAADDVPMLTIAAAELRCEDVSLAQAAAIQVAWSAAAALAASKSWAAEASVTAARYAAGAAVAAAKGSAIVTAWSASAAVDAASWAVAYDSDAAADVRNAVLRQCAGIVRARIPLDIVNSDLGAWP